MSPDQHAEHPDSDLNRMMESGQADRDEMLRSSCTYHRTRRWMQLQTFHDLWDEYSFQIMAVTVAVLLLVYTIAGLYQGQIKCYNNLFNLGLTTSDILYVVLNSPKLSL